MNSPIADKAEALRANGETWQAIQSALAHLGSEPMDHSVRLVLARAFYDVGLLEFAIREIEHLSQQLPENQSLRRLLEQLAPDRVDSKKPAEGALANRAQLESQSVARHDATPTIAPKESEPETLAEGEFDIDILEEVQNTKDK